jgi:hypothetical protein
MMHRLRGPPDFKGPVEGIIRRPDQMMLDYRHGVFEFFR